MAAVVGLDCCRHHRRREPMRVELEFLDRAGTRVHEQELGYDGAGPPIPGAGRPQ